MIKKVIKIILGVVLPVLMICILVATVIEIRMRSMPGEDIDWEEIVNVPKN